ncbi:MAG: glycosyltransferase family 2 protein [bacterium]
MIKTPVAIFTYRRIDNLERLVAPIRRAKPKELYLISDGPKNIQEAALVNEVRTKLARLIDWPCQVHKNYAKTNMGLKERFSTGIDWVFKYECRAIFIEDDCIAGPTFFKFCDELLERYKDDEGVFSISGNNFQFGSKKTKESYYFSRYPHIWGWATWKRAWNLYDTQISDWPTRRSTSWLLDVTHGFIISKFWKYIFDRLYGGKINTWDYQLTYASFKNHGLNIIPSVNLVTNVGYGADSTNIKKLNKTIGVATSSMQFPLVHPKRFVTDDIADSRIDNLVYLHPLGRVSLLIKSILGII